MKKILTIIAITASLYSCTKGFEEINIDPNRIDQISPGTLLNPVIYEMNGFNMQAADDITFNLMQVSLPFPSPTGGVHRYDIPENIGNGTWNTSYRWLANVNEMYRASVTSGDSNYIAIALTLKSWIYANLTDCFGDVPMEEAVRAEEQIFQPSFDRQHDIYPKLLAYLDTANQFFNPSRQMIYGTDILFANNVARWKMFANSLHMRLLLRLSNVPEINAYERIKQMIDDEATYPVFKSNGDGAILSLSGVTPLTSPWGRPVDFTTFRAAGQFFIDGLNAMEDPRREKVATQARNAAGTETIGFRGIPSGYAGSESQFDFIPSNKMQALVTAPMVCPILPYAEVEFIKAEVEREMGNEAAAKTAYEKGVSAAIEQWGASVPQEYFANPRAAYDGSLERIMEQKYYALFFVDFQQWFENRRTGLPELPEADGMLNNKQLPSRLPYPITVRTNNPQNYQQAVERMGGDDVNIKVWWNK